MSEYDLARLKPETVKADYEAVLSSLLVGSRKGYLSDEEFINDLFSSMLKVIELWSQEDYFGTEGWERGLLNG